MLVIPTWTAENSYVLLPWVVSHSIFGLFILEGWQIDLHPKTPSGPCWSAAFSWHCYYGWMAGTLITSPIGTPTLWRGWITRGVSRKLWPSFPSVPPDTSTSMLRMSVPLLRPTINCITTSCLSFERIFFHAPLPLFDIICSGGGPHLLHHSVGMSWPLCLSSLFCNSFCQWLSNLPVQSSQSPLPELPYQPSWWGPSSWILHLLHSPRGVLPCMIIIQRIGLHPQG